MDNPKKKLLARSNSRKPSALKHGAFSPMELMPWENEEEFKRLYLDLVDQYQPKGVLQEDCMRTLTGYLWRKRRVQEKRRFDIAAALQRVENNILWEHPPPLLDDEFEAIKYALANMERKPRSRPPDDYQQLLGFSGSLYRDVDRGRMEWKLKLLPQEHARHLQEKIPRSNYESTVEWIVALKK